MNPQSPAVILRTLKIIHLAMFSSIAIFSGICIYLRNKLGMTLDRQTVEILYYVSLTSVLIFIPMGYWLHGKKIKSLINNPDLLSKLTVYQTSHITKIALFETSGFLSLIVLITGGNNYVLLQIGIVLVIMLLNTPSVYKLTTELNLSPDEIELLKF